MKYIPTLTDQINDAVGSKGTDGVEEILHALIESVYETAEHIRSNWQDEFTAKEWEKFARKLENLEGTLP